MAMRAYIDHLGNAVKYTYKFGGDCPATLEKIARLQDQFTLTLSSSTTSDYGGDKLYDADADVEFLVNESKECHIYVNNIPRRIKRVSDLPGNDRVLRYTDAEHLSAFEKKVIKKFTTFIKETRIEWDGPFSCIKRCSVSYEGYNHRQCSIISDRPVPLYRDRMSSSWKADCLGNVFTQRTTGGRLYHFRAHAPENKDTMPDRYVYAGADIMCEPTQTEGGCDKNVIVSAKQFCLAFLKSREILETHCVDGKKIVNTVVVNLAKIMVHEKLPTTEEAMVTIDEKDTVLKRMYVPSVTATDASGELEFDLRLDDIYDIKLLSTAHKELLGDQGIWALRLDPWLRQMADLRTFKMLNRACRVASDFAEVAEMCGMGRNRSRMLPYLQILPHDWIKGKDVCCFLRRDPVLRPLSRPLKQYFTLGSLRMIALSEAGRRYYNGLASNGPLLTGNVLHFGEFEAEELDVALLPDGTIVL